MVNIYQSTVVIDIETTGLDFNKNRIKRVGLYSYQTKQYIILSDLKEVQRILNQHDVIVGYNIENFDEPFLRTKGVRIKGKILDLYKIIKKRQPIIKHKFDSLTLKNVCNELGIGEKGDINLSVLIAEENTLEEKKEIDKYLKQDVLITKRLYEWLENTFYMLKSFLPASDARNYGHLTLSPGSYAYKVICRMAELPELYNHNPTEEKYKGGFVLDPRMNVIKGNIICLDFNSAYPHAFMMQNLYNKYNDDVHKKKPYNGNDLYTLSGTYSTDELGIIEKVIQKLFALRKEYKKNNDPREYAIKIIINVMYGITGDPRFLSVFNIETASDCTKSVRGWLLYALSVFEKEGYIIIYGDTDSLYLRDPFNDMERLLKIKDKVIAHIKSLVPFPLDTFDMGIDERIKSMYFFESQDKKKVDPKKKSYIYITQEDKLIIKGLAVIKGNSSRLSKNIIKQLTPDMIKRNDIFYKKDVINKMILSELEKDITIGRTKFNIKERSSYKSTTSIQYGILEMYGEGTHKLIKNRKIGAGKGVKYCSLKEAKNLTIADLDLSTIWEELNPFIKKVPVRSIFSF